MQSRIWNYEIAVKYLLIIKMTVNTTFKQLKSSHKLIIIKITKWTKTMQKKNNNKKSNEINKMKCVWVWRIVMHVFAHNRIHNAISNRYAATISFQTNYLIACTRARAVYDVSFKRVETHFFSLISFFQLNFEVWFETMSFLIRNCAPNVFHHSIATLLCGNHWVLVAWITNTSTYFINSFIIFPLPLSPREKKLFVYFRKNHRKISPRRCCLTTFGFQYFFFLA